MGSIGYQMTETKNLVGYGQIYEALADLCLRKRTGTMFITTWDNHSARFILEDGLILSCHYSVKRGPAAIPLLKSIQAGTYRFADGVINIKSDHRLPPTNSLLNELRPPHQDADLPPAVNSPRPSASTSRPPSLEASPVLIAAKKELTRHLGPVAERIFQNYLRDNGMPTNNDQLSAFLTAMARQLGKASKARAFLETVSKSIT